MWGSKGHKRKDLFSNIYFYWAIINISNDLFIFFSEYTSGIHMSWKTVEAKNKF